MNNINDIHNEIHKHVMIFTIEFVGNKDSDKHEVLISKDLL